MARKSKGLGNPDTYHLKQLEKEVARQRKKLGLPPAHFLWPDNDREKVFLKHPNQCSFCGSTEINAGDMDGVANVTTMRVSCDACGGRWTEAYVLVGAFDFEPGDGEESSNDRA